MRTTLVDAELAAAIEELSPARAGAGSFATAPTAIGQSHRRRLNEYIREFMGDEFTAKDFRTWGGTLTAAIAFADTACPRPTRGAAVADVMRRVGEKLGNTPAVARSSYVSPAVVEQYLDGRTLADFRPRHLRVVKARDIGLDPEEQASLSLLRSWRINVRSKRRDFRGPFRYRLGETKGEGGNTVARKTVLVCDICAPRSMKVRARYCG